MVENSPYRASVFDSGLNFICSTKKKNDRLEISVKTLSAVNSCLGVYGWNLFKMFVNLNDYSFSVPQNPRSLEQILSKYLESLNRQAGNLPFCYSALFSFTKSRFSHSDSIQN